MVVRLAVFLALGKAGRTETLIGTGGLPSFDSFRLGANARNDILPFRVEHCVLFHGSSIGRPYRSVNSTKALKRYPLLKVAGRLLSTGKSRLLCPAFGIADPMRQKLQSLKGPCVAGTPPRHPWMSERAAGSIPARIDSDPQSRRLQSVE